MSLQVLRQQIKDSVVGLEFQKEELRKLRAAYSKELGEKKKPMPIEEHIEYQESQAAEHLENAARLRVQLAQRNKRAGYALLNKKHFPSEDEWKVVMVDLGYTFMHSECISRAAKAITKRLRDCGHDC